MRRFLMLFPMMIFGLDCSGEWLAPAGGIHFASDAKGTRYDSDKTVSIGKLTIDPVTKVVTVENLSTTGADVAGIRAGMQTSLGVPLIQGFFSFLNRVIDVAGPALLQAGYKLGADAAGNPVVTQIADTPAQAADRAYVLGRIATCPLTNDAVKARETGYVQGRPGAEMAALRQWVDDTFPPRVVNAGPGGG